MIEMPVVSLSSAKNIQVVIAMGVSNAAPGVLDVKRSELRAGKRLEYQKLVIWPRMTDMKAMASSKHGQSSMGDGCWLTRRRQTSVRVRGATEILYKGTIHARNGHDDVPLQPLWSIHLSTSGITRSCNTQAIIPRMTPTDTSKKPCIPVYSRPPTIDNMYKTRRTTQVANDMVEREPARWRSWIWVPRNKAMDIEFVEWVEG
jgi:hypothetical protein